MTDPADYEMRTPPTWQQDLGALRAASDYLAAHPGIYGASPDEIATWSGLDAALLRDSLARWERAWPEVWRGGEGTLEESICVTQLTERGRQIVGLWPSPEQVIDRLIAALSQAAENEPDEAKQSKLKAGAIALATVARDIGVAAVGQTIGGMM